MSGLLNRLENGYGIFLSLIMSLIYLVFLAGTIFVLCDYNIEKLKIFNKKILINIMLVFIGFYIW
jgi:hypothetical protein